MVCGDFVIFFHCSFGLFSFRSGFNAKRGNDKKKEKKERKSLS